MSKSILRLTGTNSLDVNKENPIRVLQVDDEVGFQKTTKQILEMHGQFQVDSASSVKEALEEIREKKFDVIVSDYQMPVKDGLEFLKELRDNGNNTPFILFTGKGREEVAIEALNLGADRYFNKIGKPETVYGELIHGIIHVVKSKQGDARQMYFNKVLQACSDVNQFLLKEKKLEINELIKGVCKRLTATKGYQKAWIVLIDKENKLDICEFSGVSNKEFNSVAKKMNDGNFPVCSKIALENPGAHLIKDPLSVCSKCSLSKISGDQRAFTIQLQYRGNIYGFLTVYVPNSNVYEEKSPILTEISGDISFFIYTRELEEKKAQKTWALGERVKELRCLYGISKLIENQNISEEEILKGTNDLLSPAWQYPEVTCSRIIVGNKEFRTKTFKETPWKQSSEIIIYGKKAGVVEVYYLEEKPSSVEGPFLEEERHLIDAVAERLGRALEQKKAEKELMESERKYSSLFKNMLEGFAYCKIILDKKNKPIDFIYLDINDAFEKITGLNRENVLGKKVSEAIPGTIENHPELFEAYGRVALTGKKEHFDIHFKHLDIWLHISVYSPKKGYFVAVFENITERKRIEDELRQSEKKFFQFFENAPEYLYMISPEGKILDINNSALRT